MTASVVRLQRETATRPCGREPSLLEGLVADHPACPAELHEPGPGYREVKQLVAAALAAQEHYELKPCRFIYIGGRETGRLGEIFAQLAKRRDPLLDEAGLERERDRARKVPSLVAVAASCKYDHPSVSVLEQHASIGAAVQNLVLCAQALGYAARIECCRSLLDMGLAASLGLATDEFLFGFVCLGTPNALIQVGKKPRVGNSLSVWKA